MQSLSYNKASQQRLGERFSKALEQTQDENWPQLRNLANGDSHSGKWFYDCTIFLICPKIFLTKHILTFHIDFDTDLLLYHRTSGQ